MIGARDAQYTLGSFMWSVDDWAKLALSAKAVPVFTRGLQKLCVT